jgi:hypothetical protein
MKNTIIQFNNLINYNIQIIFNIILFDIIIEYIIRFKRNIYNIKDIFTILINL